MERGFRRDNVDFFVAEKIPLHAQDTCTGGIKKIKFVAENYGEVPQHFFRK